MNPSSNALARNLEALEHALGGRVVLPVERDQATHEPGASPEVLIEDGRGNRVRYHSARDPYREAEQALQNAAGAEAPSLVVIIGAGLGYLPEVVGKRFPDAHVLVIEPEPSFVRRMLSRYDWRPALTSGRLLMLVGPDYTGSSAAWRMVDSRPPVVIEHPVLARVRPAAIEEGRSVLKRIIFDARANAAARERFEGPYLVNTLRNVPVLAREADAAALDARFERVPAVVVAAGPSLDRRIDELRALQDRAVIVAVDTAARPLLSSGVRPHLVVALDPSALNARHLEGLPVDPGTWLAAECSLHPSAFASFTGRTFCFRVAEHEPWPWLRGIGLDAGLLRAWGSVLTTAFDFALRMGCDPIVFVGADLAYTDDRPYSRRTIYEEDWARETARGHDLRALWRRWMTTATSREAAVDGTEAVTSPRLVAFRGWIVEAASHATRRVINATGGGILRGGRIEQLSLRQAIELTGPRVDRSALDAIWRSSASAATRTRVAALALDELQRGAHPEVRDRWRTICETSGLDLDDVLSATARRLATADHVPPLPVTPYLLPPHLPERLALFRSFVLSAPAPDWLVESRAAGAGLSFGDAMRQAASALQDVASTLPSQLAADRPAHVSASLPLTALSGTDLATFRGWLRFEGHLGAVLGDQPPLLPQKADPLFAVPETPWADEPVEGAATIAGEALRCAAVLEWGMVAAAGEETSGFDIDGAGVFDLLDREGRTRLLGAAALSIAASQVTGEALEGSDGVACRLRLEGDGGDVAIGAARGVRMRYLMRALTGLLLDEDPHRQAGVARRPPTAHALSIEGGGVRWRLDLDPAGESAMSRTRFLAATRTAPRMVLSDRLPRGLAACTLNAHEAVLGAVHTHESFAVDENGSVRQLSTWPRPLIAEVPWGTEGGALAWHGAEEGSYIMVRRTASAEPEISPVAFGPSWPLVEADGRTLWSSYFGGLWSWHPDGASRLEADIPPTMGIRRQAGGVRLDPITRRGTSVVRMPLSEALLWYPDTGHVDALALGPAGVSWSISVDDGWTAEGHPHADLVRITSPSGRAFALACYFPFSVAWAGRSLVVLSTTSGIVLFFPRLRDVLEAWS
jgi:hypothetical protein